MRFHLFNKTGNWYIFIFKSYACVWACSLRVWNLLQMSFRSVLVSSLSDHTHILG